MPRLLFVLLCLAGWLSPAAQALVVLGSSETDGTDRSAPTGAGNDFGFANVAEVFDTADNFFASGVYLGSGWMISAYHVVRQVNSTTAFSFGNVVLSGQTYTVNPSSAVRLTNSDHTLVDLALFRLTTVPSDLKSLAVSASNIPGTAVVLTGVGQARAANETHWNVDSATDPDTWTVTSGAGDRQGFFVGTSLSARWGANNRLGETSGTNEFGTSPLLFTSFDQAVVGQPNEAQAAGGDSGGGVFAKRGSQWELFGIVDAVNTFDGQPGNTAVYGNYTYAVKLTDYQAQIAAIVPEPGVAWLLLGGVVPLLRRHRRA